jgi:hypothetical protein
MKSGKLLWLLAAVLVAGGGYAYFHGRQAQPAAERYRMADVVRGDLVRYVLPTAR